MEIKIAFSPCPNDTFIFDAMVNKKIDTGGIDFIHHMADVEQLNNYSFRQIFDVCKVSFHAYLHIIDSYILLNSGSALGNDVGPLLISKNKIEPEKLQEITVAIPGKYTTANLLLSIIYPQIINKTEVIFSEIEDKILKNEVEAGVIIHENRFTYQNKGLKLIADLGNKWKELTNQPIPLGGIVVKRNLPSEIIQKINKIMKKSVEYALNNPNSSKEFVRCNAQEMSEDVMKKHIQLYVNDYTVDLGYNGKNAVKKLFQIAVEKGLINEFPQKALFL